MLGTVLCFLRIRVTNQPLSLGVGLAQPHLLRVWIGVGFGVCDPGTLTGVLVRSHVAQASTSARSQRPQPFKELGLTTSCLCLALRRVVPRCIGSLRLAFDVVLRLCQMILRFVAGRAWLESVSLRPPMSMAEGKTYFCRGRRQIEVRVFQAGDRMGCLYVCIVQVICRGTDGSQVDSSLCLQRGAVMPTQTSQSCILSPCTTYTYQYGLWGNVQSFCLVGQGRRLPKPR